MISYAHSAQLAGYDVIVHVNFRKFARLELDHGLDGTKNTPPFISTRLKKFAELH